MRAVQFHEPGDESVLTFEEVDTPSPSPEEVRVRVRAAGINPFDTYVREGRVSPASLPHVGGGDVAGTVDEVGDAVTAFAPGDRVFATGLGLDRPGAYAEYVPVPADRLAPLPDQVGFVDGAAAAEPFTTAWHGLVHRGGLAADDVCLVQGASGGVGHAAVQVAVHAGAAVVGTARDGEPAAVAERLGARVVVDYRADDLADRVRRAAGGRPIDVVLETHAATNIGADVHALADGGRIVLLGEDAPITVPQSLAGLAKKRDADLRFVSHMASVSTHAPLLERVGRLLADGTFEVVVADTYPLPKVAEAHRRLSEGGVVGKLVVEVDG